jgi:hypothetical protein
MMTTTTNPAIKRIAMWSGPRNISTAMMRSWGNRADTVVVDEPLYAHYLRETGLDHPGANEVMAHDECDWRRVIDALCAPLPAGKSVFYQKHMAHHLLPSIDRDWLSHAEFEHVFLIRDPKSMLISLDKVTPDPRVEDTGLPQQVEVHERVRETSGVEPIVIDSRDVLMNPEAMLRAMCEHLGVNFDFGMLRWPAGPRATDGVWAKYWYDRVNTSTEFSPFEPNEHELTDRLSDVHARCVELYEHLHQYRIRA